RPLAQCVALSLALLANAAYAQEVRKIARKRAPTSSGYLRWDCLAIAADVWRRSGGRQSTFVRCLGNVADQGDSCV
ncbi:hypothetical protein VDR27_20720, partial [Xanthomonas campestris pv. campestris]|nr:hypothetical protein [Xanthomonas campestris pv. campestris]